VKGSGGFGVPFLNERYNLRRDRKLPRPCLRELSQRWPQNSSLEKGVVDLPQLWIMLDNKLSTGSTTAWKTPVAFTTNPQQGLLMLME